MISKASAFLRIAAPLYLSLSGVLSNYSITNTNPKYADLHPVRTAIYEKSFNSPSIIFIIITVWVGFELARWLKNKYGNPKQKELIKFILNQYRDKAFNIQPGDPEDHHRVTLFQFKNRYVQLRNSHWTGRAGFLARLQRLWPRSCLVFFLRSGKLSQSTNVVFPVYDESDKTNGWASHVWSTGCAAVVDHLPDTADGNVKEYAIKTKSTVDVIERYKDASRSMPRAIAAIPVEVNGAAWGVLVLDSRRPDGVSQDSIDNFKITVAAIQKILEVRL